MDYGGTLPGGPRSGDSISILPVSGCQTRHVAVPAKVRDLWKVEANFISGFIEQAEFDTVSGGSEYGEVHAVAVVCRAQGIWLSR